MKIQYVTKNFSPASLDLIQKANAICDEYAGQGFILTLRQLYYQFVSRALIDNTQRAYKRLGSVVNDGRLAGLIDWDYITDRTRNLQTQSHWGSPASIIQSCAESYAIDKWHGQDHRVEVWIEKDALIGVIEGVCDRLDVPYFSCRGYTSQSEMWGAGQRLRRYVGQGFNPVIIHLGDHDPSGIDMTRDITDRLELFSGGVTVNRIALSMEQIEEYSPPPNPAKTTDSRAADYIALYGDESWELDALEPAMMAALIEETVKLYRDEDIWQERMDREETERDLLERASANWDEIADGLQE